MIITAKDSHDLILQLKKIRKKHKITMKEVGEAINCHEMTIFFWEKKGVGRKEANLGAFLKYFKFLQEKEGEILIGVK